MDHGVTSPLDPPRLPKSVQTVPNCKGVGVLIADIRLTGCRATRSGLSFQCHLEVGVHRGAITLAGASSAGDVGKLRGW